MCKDSLAEAHEIEVTPEMIEAGLRAVDPDDAEFLDRTAKVELVFRAMLPIYEVMKANVEA